MADPWRTSNQAYGANVPSNPKTNTGQPPNVDRATKPTGAEWAKIMTEKGKNTSAAHTGNTSQQNMDWDDDKAASRGYPHTSGGGNTPKASSESRYSGHHQRQDQIQRSLEASKQMLFSVYGNLVAIVEEFERREDVGQKTKLPKSNIYMPDQTRKSDEDVQAVLETQLILFQQQAAACPPGVMQTARDDMKKKTLEWAAVRSEHKHDYTAADSYIGQLYEILSQGKTHHSFYDKPSPEIDARTIQDNMPYIMSGKHDAAMLDKDFKQNGEKRAVMPDIRQATLDHAYRRGADRIVNMKPDLRTILMADVERFERDAPANIR
ncbi:uncharacterized protein LOC127876558 [Dreissena polymorpha]|uniref:Uncharacterized protein n=1 Tax=Dreissena polymorpha TaxID=45954 RepID=A0A9D4QU73_DREPO|nr:uncharacterized protein LOC127876558 [Dreissena polymorpha]KAH3842807.1 hypothetical protein DPMN_116311 [Dreissena polymorpha]